MQTSAALVPTEFAVGREELRRHIVAVKQSFRAWPDKYDAALSIASKLYEAGTHEMCQGREGATIIQYLIPRKRPVGPRPFAVSRYK